MILIGFPKYCSKQLSLLAKPLIQNWHHLLTTLLKSCRKTIKMFCTEPWNASSCGSQKSNNDFMFLFHSFQFGLPKNTQIQRAFFSKSRSIWTAWRYSLAPYLCSLPHIVRILLLCWGVQWMFPYDWSRFSLAFFNLNFQLSRNRS